MHPANGGTRMSKLSIPVSLVVLVWLATSLMVAGFAATAAVTAVTLLFCLPGIPITVRLLRYDWPHRWTAPLIGALSGVVLSAAINACVVWLTGWRPIVTAATIAFVSVLLHLLLRGRGRDTRRGLDVARDDAM